MPQYDYDLFVIGAGSGGVRAARLAAMTGARVAVAEEHEVGGTCVVRGCIPKKFMVYASDFAHEFKTAKSYGWHMEARFDWREFLMAKDIEIARLSGIYTANLGKAGVELFHERATLIEPHCIKLGNSGRIDLGGFKDLIATGGRPWKPDDLERRRTRHHLGRSVPSARPAQTHPDRGRRLYRGRVRRHLRGARRRHHPDLPRFEHSARLRRRCARASHRPNRAPRHAPSFWATPATRSIEKGAGGLLSRLNNGIEADDRSRSCSQRAAILTPRTSVSTRRASSCARRAPVAVDECSRTNVEHIWAIGDVTDRMNLTPVAIPTRPSPSSRGTAFKNNPSKFDFDNVPTAVFSQPPVGVVGLTGGLRRASTARARSTSICRGSVRKR